MSKEVKAYIGALLLMLVAYLLISNFRFIIPYVASDEYYEERVKIDKNLTIRVMHNEGCPLNKRTAFKRKYSKYEVLIKNSASICDQCFSKEEAEKIILLHNINIAELIQHYAIRGSNEAVNDLMETYNCNVNIGDVYY